MPLPSDGEIRLSQIAAELGVSQGEFRLSNFITTGNFTGTKGMKRFYGFSSGLFDFTTFTFSNAGAVGRSGPSSGDCSTDYSGENWLATYFSVASGIQTWTIPSSGTYEIEVAGSRAAGGNYQNVGTTYGKGAILRARFSLTGGETLSMLVGQYDTAAANGPNYNGAGGGGGTFVVSNEDSTLLVAAGGGGGAGAYSGYSSGTTQEGSDGVTTTTGDSSFRGAPGGSAGSGGETRHSNAGNYNGGGGGGYTGDGEGGDSGIVGQAADNYAGGAGLSYSNGGTGGAEATNFTYEATHGGFGGGGGGTPICGGGGGGYSGGGGSNPGGTESDGGGGGGSYIKAGATTVATSDGNYAGSSTFGGVAITNIGSYRNDHGYVKITKI